MSTARGGSKNKTVFIGNISFDATEEALRMLFSSVGQVTSLRLVADRETGKRKGFGFIEFSDSEMALSAARNLDEIDFHGRPLRVKLAEQDQKTAGADAANSRKRKERSAGGAGNSGPLGGLPVPGWEGGGAVAIEPLAPVVDPVGAYVERLGRAQMFELAMQAKHFAATQPAEAVRLFSTQPNAYNALQLVIDRLAGPHWPPAPMTDPPPSSSEWAQRVGGGGGGGGSSGGSSGAFDPQAQLASHAAALGVEPAMVEMVRQMPPEQIATLPAEQQQEVLSLQEKIRVLDAQYAQHSAV
jgi:hypothetical protein